MTLPTSGALSLNDIKGEFGGPTSPSLGDYYAGGTYVPAGTSGTNGAVPSTGTISISNFYGTSNVVINFDAQTISGSRADSAQAGYWVFGAGGNIGKAYEFVNFGAATFLEQWITPTTTAGNYEVYVTVSGDTPTGTLNSWVALSGNPAWSLDAYGSGTFYACDLSFQVRKTGTTTVLDTWTVSLQAEAF
jgi:hypothetical protein